MCRVVSHADANIRDWLKQVGALIAPAMSQQEFGGRVNILVPNLAAEFPPGAFSAVSARHVARQCRFFPNFAECCAALAPWWREHRPLPPALPEPVPELPPLRSPEEAAKARAVAAEAIAALRHTDVEHDAKRAKDLPPYRTYRNHLTRAELDEAYRRANLRAPTRCAAAQPAP